MKLVMVLVALVFGSIAFHFLSPWWFTPLASNWSSIDLTINITFWVTGFVFVAINLFLAYTIYKYRHNKNRKSHYEPENPKLEIGLSIFTALGVLLMLAPGLIVWHKFINVPDDAKSIEVVAQQWQWEYRFPGEDGVLGKSAIRYISPSNSLGIDPRDPLGQDDIIVASNALHLPIDQPVKVLLRSKDVLHNFAVPQFRVKMDIVPGLVSYLWFTPTKLGSFDILCMELCGVAHHTMRNKVVINTADDFQLWLATQPTFSETQNGVKGNPIAGELLYTTCASCHGLAGEGNITMNAPRLNHQSPWYLQRQLRYYKLGIRGSHQHDSFGAQMAAMASLLQDGTAIKDVVAYIETFEPLDIEPTHSRQAIKGKSLYVTCAVCHGKNGEGNFSLNAPRLAGIQDWYIKRQIINFRTQVRGYHQDDNFGSQMIMMAKMISDEAAIDDLVAYIHSL